MKIYIKNMVCDRCCFAVTNVLDNIGLKYVAVALGEVDFSDFYGQALNIETLNLLRNDLEVLGFSILNDQKSKLIENIKLACINYIESIESIESLHDIKLSTHISKNIKLEYNYLSHLFSVVEGLTIEQYFIRLRMEKVKELLVYDEMAIGEIAFHLGFSSVAHLSSQFKNMTGLTPGYFRSLKKEKLRLPINNL